jgi:hypothetical protein
LSVSDIALVPVVAGVSSKRNCEDTKLGQTIHGLFAAQRGRGHAFSLGVLTQFPSWPPGTGDRAPEPINGFYLASSLPGFEPRRTCRADSSLPARKCMSAQLIDSIQYFSAIMFIHITYFGNASLQLKDVTQVVNLVTWHQEFGMNCYFYDSL